MNRFGHIILMSVSMCWLSSCSGSVEEIPPTPSTEEKLPINWQVQPQKTIESKALIGNNEALQNACTPSIGKSIGVWGTYEIKQGGQTYTHVEFDATPLVYATKTEDTTNPHNDWNYPGENKYWEPGGKYTFRACFPQDVMQEQMTEINADIIQGPLNTATLQEDLMVATTYVNTLTDDLSKPVPLDLIHIFSALQFKVKAADGYTPPANEGITACWLQNQSNDKDLLTTSGYVVFSGSLGAITLQWTEYDASSAPMYHWEYADGLSFASEAMLYCQNDAGAIGNKYTKHDGWILVIPQEVKENTLHFCYTLKSTGNKVFSVPLPAITYQYGKQYTYVLVLSGASAEVALTVKDWNKLDSSYDINL